MVALDPFFLFGRYFLSMDLVLARQFEAAIAEASAGVELDPSFHPFHWSLGWALGGQGRHDDSVQEHREAVNLAPGDPLSQASLGQSLGFAGQREEALTILEGLERRTGEEYVGGWMLAFVNVGLGNHNQAISWLQEGAKEHDPLMTFINQTWFVDPLRADPRFQALLKKMNFPQVSAE